MMVSRDPFAREELHKERVPTRSTCRWCGHLRQNPSGTTYLYQYFVEHDGGRTADIPGLFCAVDCMRAYHA